MLERQALLEALKKENLSDIGLNATLADLVKDIQIDNANNVVIYMVLPKPGIEDLIKIKVFNSLGDIEDINAVRLQFINPQAQMNRQPQPPQLPTMGPGLPPKRRIPGVKRVILVGSGKGGVGKSTVAANLAVALKQAGYKVGLLDADVYGPSIPTILGLKNMVVSVNDQQKIVPVEKEGLKVISIGLMLPNEDTPVIWRGPLLMKAIQQFLFDVDWGELDYLVVDLPPGTGDVQLTLAQNLLVDGAIVVTTPQDVALADVRKAVSMFQELGIPVLGLVENMAYFVCPSCGEKAFIFGKGRVENYAKEKGLEILVQIPIEPIVSSASDEGRPVVEAYPNSLTAEAFRNLASKVIQKVSV
ncbi:MAG: Mrp/NBP35 family ATP-binding protein [Aquificota bacterium]